MSGFTSISDKLEVIDQNVRQMAQTIIEQLSKIKD